MLTLNFPMMDIFYLNVSMDACHRSVSNSFSLRRRYHVDKIPTHGKNRTRFHFGFKIAALGCPFFVQQLF